MSNIILSDTEQLEYDRLKKIVKKELELMKSSNDLKLQIEHLEKILINYQKIHLIKKPDISDKMALSMIKTQYKGMCVIARVKTKKELL